MSVMILYIRITKFQGKKIHEFKILENIKNYLRAWCLFKYTVIPERRVLHATFLN